MALAGASVCLMLLLVASGPAMATPLADRGDDTLDIDTLAATWHLREDVRALHSEVSAMREEQRKSNGMIQNHFARRLQSNSTSSGSWSDSDNDGGNDDESTHVKDLMRGKHIRVVVKIDPSMTLNMTQEGDTSLSYSGFAPELLDKMAAKGGFTYEYVRASLEGQGGGWNDAWWDMAVWGDGRVNADLFWSSSFLTMGRQSVADCTASWLDTGLHSMVHKGYEPTELDAAIKSLWTM